MKMMVRLIYSDQTVVVFISYEKCERLYICIRSGATKNQKRILLGFNCKVWEWDLFESTGF